MKHPQSWFTLALLLSSSAALANPELSDVDVGSSLSTCPVTDVRERLEATPETLSADTAQRLEIQTFVKYLPPERSLTIDQYQAHLFQIATQLPHIQETLSIIGGYDDEILALGFYYPSDFADWTSGIPFLFDHDSRGNPRMPSRYIEASRRARDTLLTLRRHIHGTREQRAQLRSQIAAVLRHMWPIIQANGRLITIADR